MTEAPCRPPSENQRTRLGLIVVGRGLSAVAVAIAGPIGLLVLLALAQETPVLLLDEPTTFLDFAARYADRIVAMKDGDIAAAGPPAQVITRDLLRAVFEVAPRSSPMLTGAPVVLPMRLAADQPATQPPDPKSRGKRRSPLDREVGGSN